MLAAVDAGQFNVPELGIAIISRLFEEWRPGPADVEVLFGQAEVMRQEMAGLMPPPETIRPPSCRRRARLGAGSSGAAPGRMPVALPGHVFERVFDMTPESVRVVWRDGLRGQFGGQMAARGCSRMLVAATKC
jgi:hypothetical protein